MLDKLLRLVLDREPVAAAAGLAGVVTATVGVLAAWDVWDPSPEQVAAIAALVTAFAGWLARKRAYAPATVQSMAVTGRIPDEQEHNQ